MAREPDILALPLDHDSIEVEVVPHIPRTVMIDIAEKSWYLRIQNLESVVYREAGRSGSPMHALRNNAAALRKIADGLEDLARKF